MEFHLNYMFSFYLFIFGLGMVCKYYSHALMMLLCIEFLVVIILLSMYLLMMNFMKDFYLLIFMVMFVMEGILGISMIVMMIRFKGNEYFNNLNLILW
uniref:NADH dehydrogenase subunit 4L n=1 Tax=Provespa barthelemyi TaxID=743389 RepID=UPI0025520BE5|nr:NADH dehydrogenase subunit 4L [Provespa barthelemyi]WGL39466.1 NADH dehydrogenase subunit 4L [Provespa barthelemyi]